MRYRVQIWRRSYASPFIGQRRFYAFGFKGWASWQFWLGPVGLSLAPRTLTRESIGGAR